MDAFKFTIAVMSKYLVLQVNSPACSQAPSGLSLACTPAQASAPSVMFFHTDYE